MLLSVLNYTRLLVLDLVLIGKLSILLVWSKTLGYTLSNRLIPENSCLSIIGKLVVGCTRLIMSRFVTGWLELAAVPVVV